MVILSCDLCSNLSIAGFSLGRLRMRGGGGICAPSYGGTSAGGQSVNGGIMRGDIDLMGGPNFDRLYRYHKLKVLLLLLLSCNYTIIGYDCIKTR